MSNIVQIAYLIASVLFVLGIKFLGKTKDARRGNMLSAVGMLIAIVATLTTLEIMSFVEMFACMLVGGAIGLYYAKKVEMTQIPEMVALFNGFGGMASLGVALSDHFFKTQVQGVEI
ncbi:MAG: NAD synthetase, partial [Cytophagales bacterium]